MANDPNPEETERLELAVPAGTYSYLVHLARHTHLGASAKDVALRLLTERVTLLLAQGFPPKHPYWPKPRRAPAPTGPPTGNKALDRIGGPVGGPAGAKGAGGLKPAAAGPAPARPSSPQSGRPSGFGPASHTGGQRPGGPPPPRR